MAEPLLEYDRVTISYRENVVVHDVSLTVCAGEVLCLVGESGSGKSTIVKAAMGQLGRTGAVCAGDIYYRDRNLTDMPARELRALCGHDIALVFQDSLAALTPTRTIGDQVFEFMCAHGRTTRAACDALASKYLGRLGLKNPAQVLGSYPFELSGGMGQRVGIAMALMGKPDVLLADEPTSALDVITQAQVMAIFKEIRTWTDVAMVIVTHNMAVARELATSVMVLKEGRVVEYGDARKVLESPDEDYTRRLIAAMPRLER